MVLKAVLFSAINMENKLRHFPMICRTVTWCLRSEVEPDGKKPRKQNKTMRWHQTNNNRRRGAALKACPHGDRQVVSVRGSRQGGFKSTARRSSTQTGRIAMNSSLTVMFILYYINRPGEIQHSQVKVAVQHIHPF